LATKRSGEHTLVHKLSDNNLLALYVAYYTGARPKAYLALTVGDIELVDDSIVDVDSADYMRPKTIKISALKGGLPSVIGISNTKLGSLLRARLIELEGIYTKPLFDSSYEGFKSSIKPVLDFLFNGFLKVRSRKWFSDVITDRADLPLGYVDGGRGVTKLVTFNGVRGNLNPITDTKQLVSLYTLRHTAATDIVAATGNLSIAQTMLGHKNISTTERYNKQNNDLVAEGISNMPQL